MQILVIAATEAEIEPFLKQHTGADILITGIGLPSTVYHLTKRIHQIDYDLVIQAGIAGRFNSMPALAEVVVVQKDCFGDLGIIDGGRFSTIQDNGFEDPNQFPFKDGWLVNDNEWADKLALTKVSAITVNTVTDSSEQISRLVARFTPQIESMEGAGLHYVCLLENIPFVQLRSISNLVGERSKQKWKTKEAIENLNRSLSELVQLCTKS